MQLTLPPGLAGENIEGSVVPRRLVCQYLCAENHRQQFVAQELGIALRAHYQAAAARNGLGQAYSSKMHEIAETERRNKPGAARPVRTEGMRLIDDQRTAAPAGNFGDILKSGDVAVGAVKRIDRDHAGPNPPD